MKLQILERESLPWHTNVGERESPSVERERRWIKAQNDAQSDIRCFQNLIWVMETKIESRARISSLKDLKGQICWPNRFPIDWEALCNNKCIAQSIGSSLGQINAPNRLGSPLDSQIHSPIDSQSIGSSSGSDMCNPIDSQSIGKVSVSFMSHPIDSQSIGKLSGFLKYIAQSIPNRLGALWLR